MGDAAMSLFYITIPVIIIPVAIVILVVILANLTRHAEVRLTSPSMTSINMIYTRIRNSSFIAFNSRQLHPNMFHLAFQRTTMNAYTTLLNNDQSPVTDYQAFRCSNIDNRNAYAEPFIADADHYDCDIAHVLNLNPFQSPVTPQPPSYQQAKASLTPVSVPIDSNEFILEWPTSTEYQNPAFIQQLEQLHDIPDWLNDQYF